MAAANFMLVGVMHKSKNSTVDLSALFANLHLEKREELVAMGAQRRSLGGIEAAVCLLARQRVRSYDFVAEEPAE